MLIIVGSKNPVKVASVENIVKKIWPGADITSMDVYSGVDEQPTTDDEAIRGAINRAKACVEKGADIGFGLEGNTQDTEHGMFVTSWAAAADKEGTIGIGSGGKFLLPEKIAKEIRKGRELGPVMDELTQEKNTKQKYGSIGFFTNGMVTRTDGFEMAVTLALTKFIKPEYYKH
jgi:inosine/xanthosine triphosphatase